jgi:hypothetical protein
MVDPIVQTLQRAPQPDMPAPDSLARFTLGTSTAIEIENSTAFHPTDVVN